MTCKDTLELVEEIAADEIVATPEVRAHLETCPRCASALATARRIEVGLAARPAPPAPARFTSLVQSKIRRERWRTEQNIDRLFNLAMVAGVLIVVGAVLALTNVGAVMEAATRGGEALRFAVRQFAQRAAPVLGTYVAAASLLASALGMWWWAERRLTL
jgi:anti-sigma factor RsiW